MSSDLADDDLPWDICRKILLRLPAESLFRSRAVCKLWRTFIDDSSFARAHSNGPLLSHTLIIKTSFDPSAHVPLYTFDLDAVNHLLDDNQTLSGSSLDLTFDESSSFNGRFPVSACNGLILVHPDNPKSRLEIWNPTTHERLQLPKIDFCPVFVGLGYDQSAQDFKAVAMHRKQTHVYSLRSDTWRTIGDCLSCSDDESLWAREYHGVFLCGALHWLLFDNNKILALDLGTEKHRHIHLNASLKLLCSKKIDVLGGYLAVSGDSADSHFFYVWVMKNYGSDDESWTKLFSLERLDLNAYSGLRPVAYIEEKNQVFLQDSGSVFFLFDIESETMKRVCIDGLTEFLHAQIIPQSIFRIRDHCGGNGRRRTTTPLCRPRKKMKVSLTVHTHLE